MCDMARNDGRAAERQDDVMTKIGEKAEKIRSREARAGPAVGPSARRGPPGHPQLPGCRTPRRPDRRPRSRSPGRRSRRSAESSRRRMRRRTCRRCSSRSRAHGKDVRAFGRHRPRCRQRRHRRERIRPARFARHAVSPGPRAPLRIAPSRTPSRRRGGRTERRRRAERGHRRRPRSSPVRSSVRVDATSPSFALLPLFRPFGGRSDAAGPSSPSVSERRKRK